MPVGATVFPDKAKLAFFSAAGLLGATVTNFRMALCNNFTPNDSTDEVWADYSANEITGGGTTGYTAGGKTLGTCTLTQTAGVVHFTSPAVVWTAGASGLPAWRRAVIYYLGTLNGKVNPVVGHLIGDTTGGGSGTDIPLTSSGNTLSVTPHVTDGIVKGS